MADNQSITLIDEEGRFFEALSELLATRGFQITAAPGHPDPVNDGNGHAHSRVFVLGATPGTAAWTMRSVLRNPRAECPVITISCAPKTPAPDAQWPARGTVGVAMTPEHFWGALQPHLAAGH